MIEFYNLYYLWLLLLIPFLLLLYGVLLYFRRKRLQRFGDPELMRPLMPLVSRYRGWLKLLMICIAIFFLTISLTRPRIGAAVREVKSQGVEVIIALDVSNSMLAADFQPTRLDRAKMAISRLVDGLKGDRIGLIVFAGDAYLQLPVTTDYVSAKIFLNSINPSIISRQGTNTEKAIALAIKAYSSQSQQSRALVIITDGEDHEGNPLEMAELAAKDGIAIHTIGIGSLQGSPIKLPNGDLLKDKAGQVVVTRLDQNTLQQIAKAGNGTYTMATPSDLGLSRVLKNIKEMEKQDLYSEQFKEYHELYWIPLLIALLFLSLEGIILERKNKMLRNLDVFGKRAS